MRPVDAATIKRVRAQLIGDPDLAGRGLARRLSQQADSWFESLAADLPVPYAVSMPAATSALERIAVEQQMRELERDVTEARAAALTAGDAERARIERDLHGPLRLGLQCAALLPASPAPQRLEHRVGQVPGSRVL